MKSLKLLFGIAMALLAAVTGLYAYTPDSTTTYNLADGLVYKKYTYNKLYGGYQEIFVLEIDLSNPGLEVGIGVCQDRKPQNTATQGKSNSAYAAVNLGFFDTQKIPSSLSGLLKANGKIHKGSKSGYDSPGFTEGFLWVDKKYAGIVTPNNFSLNMAINLCWSFPVLLQKGAIYPALTTVTSDPSQIILSRRSRTAVGVTGSRQKMYIVVIDEKGARHAVTCKELADYMLSLGCYEAINMDGGGSSTMWTGAYGLMNLPQNGTYQRSVYNILFVRARQISHPEIEMNPSKPGVGGMDQYTPKGAR